MFVIVGIVLPPIYNLTMDYSLGEKMVAYTPKVRKSATAEKLLLGKSYVHGVSGGKNGYHRGSSYRNPSTNVQSPRLLAFRACVATKRRNVTGGWNAQVESFRGAVKACSSQVAGMPSLRCSRGKCKAK